MTSTNDDDPCLTPPPPAPPRWKTSTGTTSTGSTAAAAVGDSETTGETQPDVENSHHEDLTHELPNTMATPGLGHGGAGQERPPSPPHASASPMAPSPSVFARIGASLLMSQDNLAGHTGESPKDSNLKQDTTAAAAAPRGDNFKYETAPELPFVADSAENTPRTENLYHHPPATSPSNLTDGAHHGTHFKSMLGNGRKRLE